MSGDEEKPKQKEVIVIQHFKCPTCYKIYDTMEQAEACLAMGEPQHTFKEGDQFTAPPLKWSTRGEVQYLRIEKLLYSHRTHRPKYRFVKWSGDPNHPPTTHGHGNREEVTLKAYLKKKGYVQGKNDDSAG